MAGKYGIDPDSLFPWEKLEGIVYPYGDPLPYFEYFVFDDAMERVVFDVHHDSLILCER